MKNKTIGGIMKAVVCTAYGPPEVLQLREVKKPLPKTNEVLIRIHATAVTASDCIIRGFKLPRRSLMGFMMGLVLGFTKPRNPILGMVLAGEIETIGKSVTRFKPGDSVYAFNTMRFGAYAEYICLPETSVIALKPANLTYEEAAAIPYGGMLALHFLKKGNIQTGQKVLIYGASGANGTAAVQLTKYYGAEVTGVCSTANLEFVKALGADQVIDYTQEDVTNRGELYDFIFDAVGKKKSARLPFAQILKPNGTYLSVDDGTPKLHSEDLNFLTRLAEAGQLKPVIDRCYSLAQMAEAHRYVDTGHKRGNVVVAIR
ncbi:MAG TPA: NAD(P)-dependent alcohol dehydrogenase [Phototrophicaceae bacterium]|nr:NAD(P)-dependent alcohol dehydrogenase [Phototrophicaceae bacterium]